MRLHMRIHVHVHMHMHMHLPMYWLRLVSDLATLRSSEQVDEPKEMHAAPIATPMDIEGAKAVHDRESGTAKVSASSVSHRIVSCSLMIALSLP